MSILSVILVGCSVPTHIAVNPNTGRIQILPADEAWEEEAGEKVYGRIVSTHILHASPEVRAVHRVMNELLTAAALTEFASQVNRYEWQISVVVDDSECLVMDLPSGKLLMTTSALADMQNDIDLAAVLGHAIGHVLLRHGGERIAPQVRPFPYLWQISRPTLFLHFSSFNWPKPIMPGWF